jgi:D-aminoacyl-tRNA deacylase
VRAVLQRVTTASVAVDGDIIAEIGAGVVVLLGMRDGDVEADARRLADKIVSLRIFADDEGRFDRSLADVGGEVLAVSQFTLYADTRKGRRPSFVAALRGEDAVGLYEAFVAQLRSREVAVRTGRFGADMQVALINDGPVTIILESPEKRGCADQRQ